MPTAVKKVVQATARTRLPRHVAQDNEDKPPLRSVGKKGLKAKADLMTSARAVFSRLGYVNARVQDITEAADFSLGAFYRYYKDKDDILRSLVSSYFDQAYTTTFFGVRYDPENPTKSLFKSTAQTINFAVENRDLMKILWETSQTDAQIEAQWSDLRSQLNKRIIRLVERAQEDGIGYSDLDPASTAELLIGMTEQAVYRRLVRPAELDPNEQQDLAIRLTRFWARTLFKPSVAEFTPDP